MKVRCYGGDTSEDPSSGINELLWLQGPTSRILQSIAVITCMWRSSSFLFLFTICMELPRDGTYEDNIHRRSITTETIRILIELHAGGACVYNNY